MVTFLVRFNVGLKKRKFGLIIKKREKKTNTVAFLVRFTFPVVDNLQYPGTDQQEATWKGDRRGQKGTNSASWYLQAPFV